MARSSNPSWSDLRKSEQDLVLSIHKSGPVGITAAQIPRALMFPLNCFIEFTWAPGTVHAGPGYGDREPIAVLTSYAKKQLKKEGIS